MKFYEYRNETHTKKKERINKSFMVKKNSIILYNNSNKKLIKK